MSRQQDFYLYLVSETFQKWKIKTLEINIIKLETLKENHFFIGAATG